MKRLLLLAVLGYAALAAAQQKSDWEEQQEERNWQEAALKLPALPRPDALIEFFVSAASRFRFFIDPASISVGADGVVRYTLVARSAAGAENVSYEGIRCKDGSYKVYALGQGATWSRALSDWKRIEPNSVQRWHQALQREYFCPFKVQVTAPAEAVEYLRRGGHPELRRSD